MDIITAHMGEVYALLTAVVWAAAVIMFKKSGETVHPVGLNMFKNLLSSTLLLPTLWIAGVSFFRPVPLDHYAIALVSGALGIGVGDTLFFRSLNALGAGLSAIVVCLYSPFIILLSILFLDESLTLLQFTGAALIISAVLLATVEKGPGTLSRKQLFKGIALGAMAQVCNASGVVMVKPLLDNSPVLWVTEMRLMGGIAVLIFVLLFMRSRREIIQSVLANQRWGYTVAGAFLGAYLAMILWLAGMKYTQASIASALNQTSSLIIFIFAAWFLKEKITPSRLIGIVMGVTGAILVTFA